MAYGLKEKNPVLAAEFEAEDFQIEPMFINIGPSHPAMHGVIRIKTKLRGEMVVWADVEMGYLHRGFEKTAEYKSWNQVVPYTDRLNYVSPLINNAGYALAVEKLCGIQAPERAQYLRVIGSEISRICDHITCIAASAMEMGAFTAFLYFMESREYFYQLTCALTGARVTTSYTRVGGVTKDLPADFAERFAFCEKKWETAMADVGGLLTHNRIFIDRLKGVGAISAERAVSYGFTGPLLRACGIKMDVRKIAPYLVYDRLKFEIPTGSHGDNYDRYLVRMEEMRQSISIIKQCLQQMPQGPIQIQQAGFSLPDKPAVYDSIEGVMNHFKIIMPAHGIRPPKGEAYAAVEGGNGEVGFWVISDGTERPFRVRVRPPCFALTSAVEEMIVGGQVADIITTFGAVNMIAGELDR